MFDNPGRYWMTMILFLGTLGRGSARFGQHDAVTLI
jgi:hypothetical protein